MDELRHIPAYILGAMAVILLILMYVLGSSGDRELGKQVGVAGVACFLIAIVLDSWRTRHPATDSRDPVLAWSMFLGAYAMIGSIGASGWIFATGTLDLAWPFGLGAALLNLALAVLLFLVVLVARGKFSKKISEPLEHE